MKGIFSTLLTLLVMSVQAETKTVKISDIESVENKKGYFALYASDGEIYEIESKNTNLVEQAFKALQNNEAVSIELNSNSHSDDILGLRSQILSMTRATLENPSQAVTLTTTTTNKSLSSISSLLSDYITDFRSSSDLERVFSAQRRDTREDSQCYNRAHVWSWEMRKFSQRGRKVQPGKMWIFFTKKYIKEYDYKWWFHVAPFTKLKGRDMVMDRKFLRGPVTKRAWSDFFIQPRTKCTTTKRYSKYANNPYKGHCFLIRTSVHYHQPYQIQKFETGENPVQRNWQEWELKLAYKDGVGKRRVPKL